MNSNIAYHVFIQYFMMGLILVLYSIPWYIKFFSVCMCRKLVGADLKQPSNVKIYSRPTLSFVTKTFHWKMKRLPWLGQLSANTKP